MTITPNLGLTIPDVGAAGPEYAEQINAALIELDLAVLINVKTLGASGDGSGDGDDDAVTLAIAALEASPRGGVLYFPTGSYKLSGFVFDALPTGAGNTKPINIFGDGIRATTITHTGAGALLQILGGGWSRVAQMSLYAGASTTDVVRMDGCSSCVLEMLEISGNSHAGTTGVRWRAAAPANNNPTTTLAAAITDPDATSISLADSTVWYGATVPYPIKVDSEIMRVTAVSGSGPYTATVERGYRGTTKATHSNGATATFAGFGGCYYNEMRSVQIDHCSTNLRCETVATLTGGGPYNNANTVTNLLSSHALANGVEVDFAYGWTFVGGSFEACAGWGFWGRDCERLHVLGTWVEGNNGGGSQETVVAPVRGGNDNIFWHTADNGAAYPSLGTKPPGLSWYENRNKEWYFTADLDVYHVEAIVQPADTTVAVGPAAGTGATATVTGNGDHRPQVIVNTGTGTSAGKLATVTFAQTFANHGTPTVVVSAAGANAAGLQLYVTGVTASKFEIWCANAPPASQSVAINCIVTG